MWNPLSPNPQFAICVENSEYPASLELHRLYRVAPDEDAGETAMSESLTKVERIICTRRSISF